MTDPQRDELPALLTEWAGVAGLADLADAAVRPLPGGTARRSYLVRTPARTAVLRCARQASAQGLAAEADAVRAAAAVGAGPALLVESDTGLLIAHQPGRTLTPNNLREAVVRDRVCAALRLLHSVQPPPTRLDLTGWTRDYRRQLADARIPEPTGYAELVTESEHLSRALAATAHPLMAAHGDAVADNFVDDGDRVHVIDLEFAVRAEPWFDLATLLDSVDTTARAADVADAGELAAELTASYALVSPSSSEFDALVARVQAWRLLARIAWLPWAMLPAQRDEPRAARWADWVALRDLAERDLPGLSQRLVS